MTNNQTKKVTTHNLSVARFYTRRTKRRTTNQVLLVCLDGEFVCSIKTAIVGTETVMLNDLHPNCLNSPETHVQSSRKTTWHFHSKFIMGARLFSGHPRSGIKFNDGKFHWKTRLLINHLNLNNTG